MAIGYATSKNENIQIRISNGCPSEEHKNSIPIVEVCNEIVN